MRLGVDYIELERYKQAFDKYDEVPHQKKGNTHGDTYDTVYVGMCRSCMLMSAQVCSIQSYSKYTYIYTYYNAL